MRCKDTSPELPKLLQNISTTFPQARLTRLRGVAGFVRDDEARMTPESFVWSGNYTTREGSRTTAIDKLSQFSTRIINSEPETLAYLVFTNDSEPQNLYLWELYSNEAGLREVHAKSAAAEQLKEDIGGLLSHRDMRAYRVHDL